MKNIIRKFTLAEKRKALKLTRKYQRNGGLLFTTAYKLAVHRIAMNKGMTVLIQFVKADGSERIAIAESMSNYVSTATKTRKSSKKVFTYFDAEKNAVRSFNLTRYVDVLAA